MSRPRTCAKLIRGAAGLAMSCLLTTSLLVAPATARPLWPSGRAGGSALLIADPAVDIIHPPATGQTRDGYATSGPTEFVQRQGAQLMLGGHLFRFAGANEYYLGLDDNLRDSAGSPTYPTHAAVDAALDAAASLGVTVVRSHTLGISVGTPLSVEPALGVWNEAAFSSIDYAIAAAQARGLRLMIPLTDEWRWYHGGKSTFTGWRGYHNNPDPSHHAGNDQTQRTSEEHFYTDPVVVSDFENYIRHLLTHRNTITGFTYGNDPTIAIWETGNELWDAPPAWTDRIARFIKSLAPHQLVADGSAATGLHVSHAAIHSSAVDIVGGHFYPRDPTWMHNDAAVAAEHQKAYVIGEYDWHGNLEAWLQEIAADHNVAGAAFWTLLPWLPNGVPEPHGDGYALWVPGPDAVSRAANAALSTFGHQMHPGAVPALSLRSGQAGRRPGPAMIRRRSPQ